MKQRTEMRMFGGKRFRLSGRVQRWVSQLCPWSGRKPICLEWREPEGSTGCNVGEETGSGSCRLCSQVTTLGFSPTIGSHRKLWAGSDLFILVF